VNISLDSLDPERFAEVTVGGISRVCARASTPRARRGMDVKLNTVLLRGKTDIEAERIVDYAFSIGV
jgi:cyclic pyranopterin phosphate synthase